MWVVHKGRELHQTSICELRPVLEIQRGVAWEELGQVTKKNVLYVRVGQLWEPQGVEMDSHTFHGPE